MYRIELLDGTVEFWNTRIIKKILKLENGNWEVIHFNDNSVEIKNFTPYS